MRVSKLVLGLAVAMPVSLFVPFAFAEDNEVDNPNSGMTFYDEEKTGDEAKSDVKDGFSFDIAETKDPKKIDWLKRAMKGGRGNVTCYVDKDGIPTAVFVIGIAPVSSTMIAVEAEEEARFEGESNAKEAWTLWTEEYLEVKNVREHKALVVRTNGEEESETQTKNERVFTQMASASWRGMSLYGDMLKDGRYMCVWRWSVQEQQMAKMVEMLTQDGDPDKVGRKVDNKVREHDFSFRDED